jgi:hypothetical protein
MGEGDIMNMKILSAAGIDRVSISERAKQQIVSEASTSKAKLQGPSFLDGFPDAAPAPNTSASGVNAATVHSKL